MKPAPQFKPWPLRSEPRYLHWMVSGVVVLALVGCMGVLLRPLVERWLPLLGAFALMLWLLALMVRVLVYRLNRHNADCYHDAVQVVEERWWRRHRQQAALQEMVLLGPACSQPEQRSRLFMVERKPPQAIDSEAGAMLRIGQVLADEPGVREQQLARLLALQLQAQRPEAFAGPLLQCYWSGAAEAWEHFAEEMHQRFQLTLPEQPEPWSGLGSLEALIDRLHDAPDQALVLCAGCESVLPDKNHRLPAGEAAVLWLLGKTGGVGIARGESFSATQDELSVVAARALQQAGLATSPPACAHFLPSTDSDLPDLDWPPIQPPPETHFGELQRLPAMVALSLAAAHAQLNATPSAWLARDPSCTLALGVVTPDDANP